MDHDATREQLDLAAVEPGGLERLMAGDTATAQAVARAPGRLRGVHARSSSGCSARPRSSGRGCARCRRPISGPDAGRDPCRRACRARWRSPPCAGAGDVAERSRRRGGRPPCRRPRRPDLVARRDRRRTWPALGYGRRRSPPPSCCPCVTTSLVVGSRVDDQLAAQAETITALEEVTMTTMAVTAAAGCRARRAGRRQRTRPRRQPGLLPVDDRAGGRGHAASTPPAAGYEYRCWVSVDGLARSGSARCSSPRTSPTGSARLPAISGVSSGRDLRGVAGRRLRHHPRDRPGPPRRALTRRPGRRAAAGSSVASRRPSKAPSGGGASR